MNSFWIAVMLAAAAVAAQDAKSKGNAPVTLTGCVQNFSSTDANGTTEHGFVLSTTADARPTTVMPTSGPTDGVPARTNIAYVLAGHESELKDAVNKRVEVVGVLTAPDRTAPDRTATAPAESTSTPTPSTTTGATTLDRSPRLEIMALRVVGSDCTSK